MDQWQDDTLVAIHQADSGTFKVIELPARHTKMHTSRKSFRLYEQAEGFITNQYTGVLRVQYEDIVEEVAAREARQLRQEREALEVEEVCDGK
ncbi:MAG: hypothetical protein ABI413_02255 [Ktedonobacteraceae bacterium]